ncbi:MAG: NAD(P)H-dependent glycerol-3-phosphate dehydrogenase [Verrucomicrobiota bacterium]
MKIVMIGTGAWAKAMKVVLERNQHEVTLLSRDEGQWPHDTREIDFVFVAIPCQVLRNRLSKLLHPGCPVVSLIKGIEIESGDYVSTIFKQTWEGCKIGVLSGPTLAMEIQANKTSAAVVAAETESLAKQIQELSHHKLFRVYTSSDLLGVELGGALKNVYAIAGGISKGLSLGDNGIAATMTRSLAEMVRLATVLGAKKETLFGLSGVGDLMLTAYSGHSRNHQAGLLLGQGCGVEEAVNRVRGVAEGIPTIKALHQIAQKKAIRTPVLDELFAIVYEQKPVKEALESLVLREVSGESL